MDNSQKGLFSNDDFNIGDVIVKFRASNIQSEPDHLTIQLAQKKHIHLLPDYLQFVNHSCMPNVLFNTTTMEFECILPIKKGDELRFFYPATEWEIAEPFTCNCHSLNCLGTIQGAAFTSISILRKYRLTDFIQSMLENKIENS